MRLLYDETYSSSDKMATSRNIWYGGCELYIQGQYGKLIRKDDDLIKVLSEQVIIDLKSINDKPTETNWYFYESKSFDEKLLPTIMIRKKEHEFYIHFNISDHNFAIDLDGLIEFEKKLKEKLRKEVV